VSLFADRIDFLEDASINFLIFAARAWGMARRARVGRLLSSHPDGSCRSDPLDRLE
jgi:hypothetical protein